MRLLLACHAETDWNSARRYQGHTDLPLNQRGQRQAEALAGRLRGSNIESIVSSDLRRASETASIIASRLGCTPRCEARLRELAFGGWEGRTYDEIRDAEADSFQRWQADPANVSPPGGETLMSLRGRLQSFWDEVIAPRRGDQTLLLVSHRGALRALICLAVGLGVAYHWRFVLEPASLSMLELSAGSAALAGLNDTAHLREVDDAG